MTKELTIITDDQSWLDLKEGEQAEVRGELDYAGNEHITVSFSDWSEMIIQSEYSRLMVKQTGRQINIIVTRTEDGLTASKDAVIQAIIGAR